MILKGTLVNGLAVAVFSALGALVGKKLPKRVSDMILKCIGICIAVIGIKGALGGENTLIMIISISVGAFIGEIIDIDKYTTKFGNFLQRKLSKNGASTFGEGFVTASLLICIGAWAITGALDAGLNGDHTSYYAKAVTDAVSTFVIASSLGFGVVLSGITVTVYQGALVLLASVIAPILTEYAVTEVSCVGSILIIAIGTNMCGITKIKVANLIPAMVIPFILCLFM